MEGKRKDFCFVSGTGTGERGWACWARETCLGWRVKDELRRDDRRVVLDVREIKNGPAVFVIDEHHAPDFEGRRVDIQERRGWRCCRVSRDDDVSARRRSSSGRTRLTRAVPRTRAPRSPCRVHGSPPRTCRPATHPTRRDSTPATCTSCPDGRCSRGAYGRSTCASSPATPSRSIARRNPRQPRRSHNSPAREPSPLRP